MNDNKIKSSSPLSDLQHQQLLLRMEYEYEKEEFRRQTETMGCKLYAKNYSYGMTTNYENYAEPVTVTCSL